MGVIIRLVERTILGFKTLVENRPPFSSLAIANEMLRQAHNKNIEITHLKLQKLVYLAHALHLAVKREPLIHDDIQAWKHGPVIAELYEACRMFGRSIINYDVLRQEAQGGVLVTFVSTIKKNNISTEKLIETVLTAYGGLDAGQLLSLTCEPESAWGVADKYHKQGSKEYVIPMELIGEVERAHLLNLPV